MFHLQETKSMTHEYHLIARGLKQALRNHYSDMHRPSRSYLADRNEYVGGIGVVGLDENIIMISLLVEMKERKKVDR